MNKEKFLRIDRLNNIRISLTLIAGKFLQKLDKISNNFSPS